MSHRCLATAFLVMAVMALSGIPVAAQTAPRTPWGQPDLQGIWDFRSITSPSSGPKSWRTRRF